MANIEWTAAPTAADVKAAAARETARAAARDRARTTDLRTLTTVAQLRAYVADLAVAAGVRSE